ncbi:MULTISPECIES: hypothetical protein [Pseudomonas]|uniref:Uncharacterized protein n=1 Tax=Pseudomonas quercus TaxID=2722792 RepID=A0ABX0YH62_9PSED|nr:MULTISPECIES: hypothetical protein [Pseudomonas]MBF7143609.1 hypothetical protein [Pseudomonas sp. LY10J]NJP02275.1 hypothetical protein [Pseudomonas quercus]
MMRIPCDGVAPQPSSLPEGLSLARSQTPSQGPSTNGTGNGLIHFGSDTKSAVTPDSPAARPTSSSGSLTSLLSSLITALRNKLGNADGPGQKPLAASTSAPVQTPAAPTEPTAEQKLAIEGNSTDIPAADEKAPPGFDVKKINELNGGILGKLGNNQDVKKDGNSVGHLRDVLAKDPKVNGDIDNDPDAAWRAYKVLTAVKNEKNPDGSDKPADFRHNGSIGGFTAASWGDAAGGSEAGTLQDYLVKGRIPSKREDQRDPHCGENGGGTTGLQTFANKVKYGFEDFGNMIVDTAKKIGNAFVNLGHDIANGFNHFGQMVKHGFDGIGAAIRGDEASKEKEWAEARDNGTKLGEDIKDGFQQLGTIAEELGPLLLNAIPGVGTELSVAVMAAKFGAEMALKAGLKVGTKEFTEMALKEGGKELAKGTAQAAGKSEAQAAGSQVYENITGEKPSETVKGAAGEVKEDVRAIA